jgi:hypothetical protein
MSLLCTFASNADMYGLVIRLGYYLQWYGGIFASLLAPDEVPGARFALGLFISATFLALVIQTVQHGLYEADIYIILLLTFGAYLFIVPWLLWRLATGCQPLLDPSRFPLVDPGPTHSDLHSLLILAVTGYQLWFWFTKIPNLDRLSCRFYGFAFAKVLLNNSITASIVVVATELTIKWNHVTGVNTLSSAGQLIPFVIGLGVVVRVLYVWLKPKPRPPRKEKPAPHSPPRPRVLPTYAIHPSFLLLLLLRRRSSSTNQASIIHDPPIPPPLPDYAIPPPMSYMSPPERSSRPKRPSRSSHGSRSQPCRSTIRHHQVFASYDTAQPSPPALDSTTQVVCTCTYTQVANGRTSTCTFGTVVLGCDPNPSRCGENCVRVRLHVEQTRTCTAPTHECIHVCVSQW